MTPTFRLSEKTDPATIMFEGYPSITLASVERADRSYGNGMQPYFFVRVKDNPEAVHFNKWQVSPGNNHAHGEDGSDLATTNTWPRIVPRLTLTGDTDPKTVMFADRPDIEITDIRGRHPNSVDEPGDVYVETDALTLAVSAHGKIHYPNPNRPKGPVVTRPVASALDVTKPIIATGPDGKTHRYELVGTFTPSDGKEPIHHVTREGLGEEYTIQIYASTGKVISGMLGSALKFSNGPLITTEQLPVYIGGEYYTLDVTKTDGVVTNIEWKAK